MKTFPVADFRIILLLAFSLVLMAGLLSSCHKTGLLTDTSDTPISFYNASEYIQNQLKDPGTGRACSILIDTPDTAIRTDYSLTMSIPSFSNDNSNLFFHLYQYPNLSPSWISYMRVTSGLHSIVLMDTSISHRPLAYNRVSAVPDEPMTLYYADSLGLFSTWTTIDTVQPSNDNIGIRVLHLSPDAGKLFFTINNQPAAGFPDTLQYGRVTPFIRWPNPVADTLQLRFYNAGDSVDIVAIAFLNTLPGHAYNLLVRGYQHAQNYPDPGTGKTLHFNPDLKAVITQNK